MTEPGSEAVKGEPRWPMAAAVVALMVLAVVSPQHLAVFPGPLLATIEGILLVALLIGDPGSIDRETRWLRRTLVALIVILLISTLGSTVVLVTNLLSGSTATGNASDLLLAGARVWLSNNVAFALLYWGFDCGGPAARAHRMPPYPDFAFPRQLSPELAPPGWRPEFIDYLYLAFTNANAFSPTDTLPMAHWAKIAMACQALISFALIGLVIARAVNLFA